MILLVSFSGTRNSTSGNPISHSPNASLYHTGTRSALELASLGPATVLCESLIYCSTFLAIATTNLQATALADGKTAEAQKVLTPLYTRKTSTVHTW